MRKFKDAAGREWTLSITMDTAVLLRTEADFEIKDILSPNSNSMERLGSDSELLGRVLWTLVADEAKSQQIDERGFFRALSGDILDAAINALIAECFDFFPQAKRSPLQKAWEKTQRIDQQLTAEAEAKLDEMTDDELIQLIRDKIATGTRSASNSPESSASTPGGSPSGT